MKKGWEIKSLGETCEIYQPKTISTKEMVADGKYVVYGANGVIGRYDKYNHEEPQLLITCRGATCGYVNISTPKAWITGNAMVVRPKNSLIDLKFIEYLFRGGLDLSKIITGAAQPQITRTTLAPLLISYPKSLAEQQRIVAILDGVFEKTTKVKENAEKNLQNAHALFESYLHSVFTQRDKDPMRSDWHSTKLTELATVQSGSGFPIKYQGKVKGGIPFYKVSDMNITGNEREMICENNSITEEVRRELGAFLFPVGSIIFPKIGGAIATNKKRLVTCNCCVDNNVMGVIPKVGKVDSVFLYYLFLGYNLSLFANEAHLPSIKKTVVEDWEIYVPKTLPEQQRIVAKLDSLSAETKKLEAIYQQKLADLGELKRSILQKAFNGELVGAYS